MPKEPRKNSLKVLGLVTAFIGACSGLPLFTYKIGRDTAQSQIEALHFAKDCNLLELNKSLANVVDYTSNNLSKISSVQDLEAALKQIQEEATKAKKSHEEILHAATLAKTEVEELSKSLESFGAERTVITLKEYSNIELMASQLTLYLKSVSYGKVTYVLNNNERTLSEGHHHIFDILGVSYRLWLKTCHSSYEYSKPSTATFVLLKGEGPVITELDPTNNRDN